MRICNSSSAQVAIQLISIFRLASSSSKRDIIEIIPEKSYCSTSSVANQNKYGVFVGRKPHWCGILILTTMAITTRTAMASTFQPKWTKCCIKCVYIRAVNYLHFHYHFRMNWSWLDKKGTIKSNGIAVERTKPQANNNNDADGCACSLRTIEVRKTTT